jgi:hypothetical protein
VCGHCAAMSEQRTSSSSAESVEGPDVQYLYIVNIRAVETFVNLMAREGINMERSSNASFTLPRRLNMKVLKERGVFYSYSVIRVRRVEDVIEEG